MARIKLKLPETFLFETEIKLRIGDINYGGHLGNDAILSLIHEARLQFLAQYGYSEHDVAGSGIIMSDSVIVYKSQGFYGDTVTIKVTASEIGSHGMDLFYLLVNKESGQEIARSKTGLIFFDYEKQKVNKTPGAVKELFNQEA